MCLKATEGDHFISLSQRWKYLHIMERERSYEGELVREQVLGELAPIS